MPGLRILPLSLVLLALVAGNTAGAPYVAGHIHGTGGASTFQVFGGGTSLEGGLAEWTHVCGSCDIRMTLTSASFTVLQGNQQVFMGPGQYEVRGFAGLMSITQNAPGDFFLELHGTGKLVRLN